MKTVVITGTSSGIGKDLATLLIKKGYKVYGLSRKESNIEGLNEIKCDITSLDDIKNAFNIIKENEETIDVLVNNAGMGIAGSIKESSYEDINLIFNTNMLGTIKMVKEFIPLINDGGRIINLGSVAGDLTIPYQAFYTMTKSAIDKFSEALNIELKDKKIKATTILPGDTKTGFTANRKKTNSDNKTANESIKKMEKDEQNGASPSKVSNVIYKVIKSKNPPVRKTVGFSYKLFIFLQRILPRRLVIFILSKLYG